MTANSSLSQATIAAIRFGYGLADKGPRSAAQILSGLRDGNAIATAYPGHTQDEVFARIRQDRKDRKAAASESAVKTLRKKARRTLFEMAQHGLLTSFARIVETKAPFFERLTWFWADHFTVAPGRGTYRPMGPIFVDEAIRPHVMGKFGDMLRATATHPAMLVYLDQHRSIGPKSVVGRRKKQGLNENLAREILELHTLGVGADYTQRDVRQFAELLTGLTFNPQKGFFFRPEIAEPGREVILGKSYGRGVASFKVIEQALADLARHPATARHISRKLARHFVSDAPDPDLVAALEETYRETDGDLPKLYETLLSHPAAWSGQMQKIRQPLDYIAAAYTALGVRADEFLSLDVQGHNRSLWRPLASMGQTFMEAPGPNGWPEAADHWITPQSLSERISFSVQLARRYKKRIDDPRAFLGDVLGDAAGENLRFSVNAAESKQAAITLIFASAEMNRR